MDPLTALSLASSVIQFVQFGSSLVSGAVERYQSTSGTSANMAEEETITAELKRMSLSLQHTPLGISSSQRSKHETTLKTLSTLCSDVATELLDILEDLKIQGKHKRLESLIQAARSIGKEKKIEALQNRLQNIQTELMLCLMAIMSDQQSHTVSTLSNLSEQHKKMEMNSVDKLQGFKDDFISSLKDSEKEIKMGVNESLSNLIREGEKAAAEQTVLWSLKYEMMRVRHSNIEEAHQFTFDWIYNDTSSNPFPQVKFLDWLQNRNGVYWITGKAGSGKSTLMKYLYKHDYTTQALKIWAGSKEVVTASYFFWIGGSQMQRSQEGLLCSLLDDILTKCPALIPILASSRWRLALRHENALDTWSRNELMNAFAQLTKQNLIPVKFCFFVDGLDEYQGDCEEVVELLKEFADSLDIKICLSSRPWNIFERSFASNPDQMLMLQNLTRNDIGLYIRGKLEGDPRFGEFEEEEEEEEKEGDSYTKQDLVAEIVDLAEGVFLWVSLVVRDLLRGLTNADTIRVLQKRLHSLPPNLENYFMSMLNSIDMVYEEQTAQILQMALAVKEPLSLVTLSFLDVTDPDYAMKAKIRPLSEGAIVKKCKLTRMRVKARCSDLLEVVDMDSPNVFSRYQVMFLHRTVRDFLLGENVQAILKSRLHRTFNVNAYLYQSFLVQMKMIPGNKRYYIDGGPLTNFLASFMECAYELQRPHNNLEYPLLDEADRVMVSHWNFMTDGLRIRTPWTTLGLKIGYPKGWIVPLSIRYGLCGYILYKLDVGTYSVKDPFGQSPLDFALNLLESPNKGLEEYLRMVRLLLGKGASPNQFYNGRSAWSRLLSYISASKDWMLPGTRTLWFEVLELFIRAGSDFDIQFDIGGGTRRVAAEFIQSFCLEQEFARLEAIACGDNEPPPPQRGGYELK